MRQLLFLLLLISIDIHTAADSSSSHIQEDESIRIVISNFFNIIAQGMHLVASKGDKKEQLRAGSQILDSICNIFLFATKRLPTDISSPLIEGGISSALMTDAQHVDNPSEIGLPF